MEAKPDIVLLLVSGLIRGYLTWSAEGWAGSHPRCRMVAGVVQSPP